MTFSTFFRGAAAAALVATAVPGPAAPPPAEPRSGQELAQRVYDRDIGRDSWSRGEMVLVDKNGINKPRSVVTAYKFYGKLIKTFTRFTAPDDIAGTTFLSWENQNREDDQFLYLPELGRDRRIVSGQKDHSFVNTDFTYEDMERRQVKRDDHEILRSEKLGTSTCWVLKSVSRDPKDSQYGRRVSWIDKDSYVVLKTEFYDKSGKRLKRFVVNKLSKIQNIWTITDSEMNDLVSGHHTYMKLTEVKYNGKLPDRTFTRAYMLEPN